LGGTRTLNQRNQVKSLERPIEAGEGRDGFVIGQRRPYEGKKRQDSTRSSGSKDFDGAEDSACKPGCKAQTSCCRKTADRSMMTLMKEVGWIGKASKKQSLSSLHKN
jgi:hypothetical protein